MYIDGPVSMSGNTDAIPQAKTFNAESVPPKNQ